MQMDVRRLFARELMVLSGVSAAGAIWFAFLTWVAPFFYEELSRQFFLDYSYLWSGISDKVRASSGLGPVAVAVTYAIYLFVRFYQGISWFLFDRHENRIKPLKNLFVLAETPGRRFWRVIVREIVTAIVIVGVSGGVMYSCRNSYVQMKEQYFLEIVSNKEGYQNLTDNEKKRAMAQYERINPGEVVDGMLRDYGFRAQSVYYLQTISFWLLIWGYPAVLVLRSILWTMRMLREED